MRTIYLRLTSSKSLVALVLEYKHNPALLALGMDGHRIALRQVKSGFRLVVLKPELRRGIVKGITLVDRWGQYDRWVTDDNMYATRQW